MAKTRTVAKKKNSPVILEDLLNKINKRLGLRKGLRRRTQIVKAVELIKRPTLTMKKLAKINKLKRLKNLKNKLHKKKQNKQIKNPKNQQSATTQVLTQKQVIQEKAKPKREVSLTRKKLSFKNKSKSKSLASKKQSKSQEKGKRLENNSTKQTQVAKKIKQKKNQAKIDSTKNINIVQKKKPSIQSAIRKSERNHTHKNYKVDFYEKLQIKGQRNKKKVGYTGSVDDFIEDKNEEKVHYDPLDDPTRQQANGNDA